MFSRLTRRLSLLVACSVTGAAAFVLPAGAAPGGGNGGGNGHVSGNAQGGGNNDASVNLDQCRNGGVGEAPQDCDADGWNNGNLNDEQAHYVEGQSAPYRLVMEGLPLNEPITVELSYDIKHSGAHAIDFLTHYDRIAEDVLPTDGVDGVSSSTDTFPIPAPGSVGSPVPGQPTAAFNALPAAERLMSLFGGDITAMAYVLEGDLNQDTAATTVSVTFVADSATAVLAWGGHIASSADWGVGNSAAGVNGSPYHVALETWTLGNIGRQDRSMQADVVVNDPEPPAPAQLTVTKIVTNNDGGTGVVGDFQLFIGSNQVTSGTANSLSAGSYTVSEGPHEGYTSTIGGACAANGAITLTAGQVAECIITNDDIAPPPPTQAQLVVTKVVINNDGGTGVVSDFDLFVNDIQVNSGAATNLAPGVYTVSEGAHEGYTSTIGGACAADGTITLVAGDTAQCTITNDDVADDNPGGGDDPGDNPGGGGDPGDNPGGGGDPGDPGTDSNPTTDPEVDSASQTTNPPAQLVQTVQAPVSTLPTTGSSPTPASQTAPTVTSELPRTGAGVREQSLLALALLAAGLLSSALGRRRTRPSDV